MVEKKVGDHFHLLAGGECALLFRNLAAGMDRWEKVAKGFLTPTFWHQFFGVYGNSFILLRWFSSTGGGIVHRGRKVNPRRPFVVLEDPRDLFKNAALPCMILKWDCFPQEPLSSWLSKPDSSSPSESGFCKLLKEALQGQKLGIPYLLLAVNPSAIRIRNLHFLEKIKKVLQKTGYPKSLKPKITENTIF